MPDSISKLTSYWIRIGHLLLFSYRDVSNYKIFEICPLCSVPGIPQWSYSWSCLCCWWYWSGASPLCAGGGVARPDCGAGVGLGAGQPGGGRPHVSPLVQALLQRLPASSQGHHSVPPLGCREYSQPSILNIGSPNGTFFILHWCGFGMRIMRIHSFPDPD